LASSIERPLVAVVAGDTLLAREIRELLDASEPSPRVQLISAAADGASILAAEDEEAAKTLKCRECGTMNLPTEWYCESCGAELAAL